MSSSVGSCGFSLAFAMMAEIFWIQSERFLCWLLLSWEVTSSSPALLMQFLFCDTNRKMSTVCLYSSSLGFHPDSAAFESKPFQRFSFWHLLGSSLLFSHWTGPLLLCWLWIETSLHTTEYTEHHRTELRLKALYKLLGVTFSHCFKW